VRFRVAPEFRGGSIVFLIAAVLAAGALCPARSLAQLKPATAFERTTVTLALFTARDGKVRGCGIGDIASMLRSGDLTGKCADLNALFIGLVRAHGIPARDIHGVRVAPYRFGYKRLGPSTEVVTTAQHCRAEVYLSGYGWVACDPADVRKVILEKQPTNLAINDPKVVAVRERLFGAWEGNWLAYNFANGVALAGSTGPKLDFLMYPQAECDSTRLDCVDPGSFKYTIKSKELTSA